MRRFI